MRMAPPVFTAELLRNRHCFMSIVNGCSFDMANIAPEFPLPVALYSALLSLNVHFSKSAVAPFK